MERLFDEPVDPDGFGRFRHQARGVQGIAANAVDFRELVVRPGRKRPAIRPVGPHFLCPPLGGGLPLFTRSRSSSGVSFFSTSVRKAKA